jgi:hypothetical protein
MPIACRFSAEHGRDACAEGCPTASVPCGGFLYERIEASQQPPPADPRVVDVAVLDMNHGWPNLGHDSIIHAIRESVCDMLPELGAAGLALRALSFDVRRGSAPEMPGERHALYVGTGGPGHIDPHQNDGASEGSQGIREDASWEAKTFELFDAIREDEGAALLSVCHSFGVMCRWAGVARPVLRGPEKGGKSTGILENILTPQALAHPWFSRFSEHLPDRLRLRIVDNRLFDLIPEERPLPSGLLPIAHETRGIGGPRGEALTMFEFARDREGLMPRIFGSNHHPEIVDRSRQMMILRQKLDRGDVSREWYEERHQILTQAYPAEDSDQRLHVTSDFTLLAPLRFHLKRQLRLRAESLGIESGIHEDSVAAGFQPLAEAGVL